MRALCTAGLLALGLATPLAVLAAPAADPDQRAAAIESRLTMDERLQLLRTWMPWNDGGHDPHAPATTPVTAGYMAGVPRLGIPDLLETDASLGVVNPGQMREGDVATAMPSTLALAASFDPALAYAGGAMIGAEARAKGFNVLLGGGANLARDPHNGRNFEYLGEDPLLTGTMAGEAIRGTQSEGVVSTTKHFALNDQETLRNSIDVRIDEAGARESDLLAFELAIERGKPGAVMCAYNRVNGPFACGNDWLLNQVLKRDWHYAGWVMSDWGAVWSADFLHQGLDQESGSQMDQRVFFDAPLRAELAAGRVPASDVSAAVRRILRSVFAVGADRPARGPIDYAAHAAIARRAAAEGIVLLRNEGVLPLVHQKHVLLVGGHADMGVLSGGGSSQVTPPGGLGGFGMIHKPGLENFFSEQLYMPSSPLRALRARLGPAAVEYVSGYDVGEAAARAAHADVAIVFATRWQGEGSDASSLHLPEGQEALISAVAHANAHTVVVLETGNPVAMPWLAEVKAVLAAWYPGQEGGEALADVLTGAINPSGHLPISFPVDDESSAHPHPVGLGLPDGSAASVQYSEGANVGYRWFAATGTKPQFPFGFGLSYTHFALSDLAVREVQGRVEATLRVRNTGDRAGATVAQLYLVSAAGKTTRRLVGFARVDLAPGASEVVTMPIDHRLLGHWDGGAHGWRIDAGAYAMAAGSSSVDLGTPAHIELADRHFPP